MNEINYPIQTTQTQPAVVLDKLLQAVGRKFLNENLKMRYKLLTAHTPVSYFYALRRDVCSEIYVHWYRASLPDSAAHELADLINDGSR